MQTATYLSEPQIKIKNFLLAAGLPGFLLIFRSLLLMLVQRQRSFDEVASVDASASTQILYTGICFLVSVFYLSKNSFGRFLLFKTPLAILFYYHIFGMLSFLWSVNSSMTLFRAFECIAYSLLIVSVFSELSKNYSFQQIIKWLTYYAVISIILGATARARLLGEGFFSVSSLLSQQFNSTPFFFFALLLPLGLGARSLILSLSILSFSNTAYIGMALGFLFLSKGNKYLKFIFYGSMTGFVVLLYFVDYEKILLNTIFYGKEGIGIEHTTGRDKIFDLAISVIEEKPLTGYGFVAGETFIINDNFKAAIGAHNGLVSALIGNGLVGGVLYILFFISVFLFLFKSKIEKLYKSVFLSSFTLIAIHTLGNPGIGSRVYGTWIPAIVIITFIVGLTTLLNWQKEYENHLGNS
jgi:O-antigen ligase